MAPRAHCEAIILHNEGQERQNVRSNMLLQLLPPLETVCQLKSAFLILRDNFVQFELTILNSFLLADHVIYAGSTIESSNVYIKIFIRHWIIKNLFKK